MVAATLCLLCTRAPAGVAPWAVALPSIVIIGREITMSALREWCAAKGGEAHAAVKVNNLGKYKTATQMLALTVLLFVRDGSAWFANGAYDAILVDGGVYCLWVSAALALVSLWVYMSGVIGLMMASD
jgi:CDP-diacylglycerol--glycerol-3-phosphate 3-phosphatidyltransferase